MISLNYDRAVQLLNDAVKGKGCDYVYPAGEGCVYARNEKPSCIVGHVLVAAGLPLGAFEGCRESDIPLNTLGIWHLAKVLELDMDERTVNLLQRVQEAQDLGTPWGEAVAWELTDPDNITGRSE